jgi:predicted  nucleic acid-binding Zn-ribbon protein
MATPAESRRVDELEAELDLARREIRDLRSRIVALSQQIDDDTSKLRASDGQIERYRHQLRALRVSSSWRVTRPIRIIKRLIRGWRGWDGS